MEDTMGQHEAHKGRDEKSTQNFTVRKPEGKRPLGRTQDWFW